jgi:hypothetical protein
MRRRFGAGVLVAVLVGAGVVDIGPASAAVALPAQGRVVAVVPGGRAHRTHVQLAAKLGSTGPLLVAVVVHGRRSAGEQPHVLDAFYEEINSTTGGSLVVYGVSGVFLPGTRIAVVWENAADAQLLVTPASTRRTGPDRRYERRVTGHAVSTPAGVADAAAGVELAGRGTVAMATIPCPPVPAPVDVVLRRGSTVVDRLTCPGDAASVQSVVPGTIATWSLVGSYAGTAAAETRLLTVEL